MRRSRHLRLVDGLDSFFRPGREILVASSGQEVVDLLRGLSPDEAHEIGKAARRRVLAAHTAEHRAAELERHVAELAGARVA